jgi:membrane associated rhomboid family serine protease
MRAYFKREIRFGRNDDEGGITEGVHHIIMLNVVVLAVLLLLHIPFGSDTFGGTFWGIGADSPMVQWLGFDVDTLFKGRIWTLLTFSFINLGVYSLFMNMIGLYIFGPVVERALGTRQFYAFYVLCGVMGVVLGNLPTLMAAAHPMIVGPLVANLGVLVASAILHPKRTLILFPIPIPVTTQGILIFTIAMNMWAVAFVPFGVDPLSNFGAMLTAYLYMKGRPEWTKFQLKRRNKPMGKKSTAQSEMADAVDNIFDFKNKKR